MDKKLVKALKDRSQGLCEICGRPATQIHHIFGGNGRRRKTERLELIIDLCTDCHLGNEGVHQNRELDLKLKKQAQRKLERQGYTIDEVREIVGGKYYV